jgi:hypothetical protein
MERISTTLKVAQHLARHEKVEWVNYAARSPRSSARRAHLSGRAPGILTFGVKGGRDGGAKFQDALKLFTRLVNIGDAKSLATHPASTTHRQLSPAELAKAGVKEDTVRLSIGIEHIDDLSPTSIRRSRSRREAGVPTRPLLNGAPSRRLQDVQSPADVGRRPARNRRTPQRRCDARPSGCVPTMCVALIRRALVAQCTPPVRSHLRATGGCRGRPARSARSLRRTGSVVVARSICAIDAMRYRPRCSPTRPPPALRLVSAWRRFASRRSASPRILRHAPGLLIINISLLVANGTWGNHRNRTNKLQLR